MTNGLEESVATVLTPHLQCSVCFHDTDNVLQSCRQYQRHQPPDRILSKMAGTHTNTNQGAHVKPSFRNFLSIYSLNPRRTGRPHTAANCVSMCVVHAHIYLCIYTHMLEVVSLRAIHIPIAKKGFTHNCETIFHLNAVSSQSRLSLQRQHGFATDDFERKQRSYIAKAIRAARSPPMKRFVSDDIYQQRVSVRQVDLCGVCST